MDNENFGYAGGPIPSGASVAGNVAYKYRVRPLFACKDEKVGYKREFYIMDFFLNPLKEV